MRNDVKPIVPENSPRKPARKGSQSPASGSGGSAFDAQGKDSRKRERGDDIDPAGPKQSSVYGSLGTGGAVTDPSGTTGPTSRSSDRLSTTTGKLRDRDLERSARQGEAPDVRVLDIPSGDSSMSVPVIMAILAALVGVIGLLIYLSWPKAPAPSPAGPRVGDSAVTEPLDSDL